MEYKSLYRQANGVWARSKNSYLVLVTTFNRGKQYCFDIGCFEIF